MLLQVASQESVVRDVLTALSQETFPMTQVLYVQWGNVRRPLPEVMDTFLQQLTLQQGEAALFAQCDEAVNLSRSFLPRKQATYSHDELKASLRLLLSSHGMHMTANLSLPVVANTCIWSRRLRSIMQVSCASLSL